MNTSPCSLGFDSNGTDAARLFQILGPRRFSQIQAVFGGKKIWIPKAGANLRCQACRLRNDCIRTWRKRGTSVEEIARRMGLSVKTIYRVLHV